MYHGKLVAAEAVRGHQLKDLPSVKRTKEAAAGRKKAGSLPGSNGDGGRNDDDGDDDDDLLSPLVFVDTAGCAMYEDGNDAEDNGGGASSSSSSSSKKGSDKDKDKTPDRDTNTDKDDSHACVVNGVMVLSRSNAAEATLVVAHALRLLKARVAAKDIAIITPYNGQVDAIKTRLLAAAAAAAGAAAADSASFWPYSSGRLAPPRPPMPALSSLTTRANHTHTRAHFAPQHWLLCQMGLY